MSVSGEGAPAADASHPVLEARHIQRNFGAVVAIADASLTLNRGEVLGLVGEGNEALVGNGTQEQGRAGIEHAARRGLRREVARPESVEALGRRLQRCVSVRERETREATLLVVRVDDRPVGATRNRRSCERVGSFAQIQRATEHGARGGEDFQRLLPPAGTVRDSGDVMLLVAP